MIPVNEPRLENREREYVLKCLESGWISSAGQFIREFEDSWAKYCGMQHGVSTSNGTTALQTAVACLGLDPGDEVIIPTFTIISCALAVIYNGGAAVLVDCDPDTWCMDVNQVESKITSRTRAIMPVHIYGHPVDMDPLLNLADKYDLTIIEDAAEAHGAQYMTGRESPDAKWKRCGGLGHISAFSFYANKLITSGEGGMILTNSPDQAEKARGLRNLCFQRQRRFYHTELGHNFRLTNLQAAIALAQVERMPEIISRKRWIGRAYTERLHEIRGLQLPIEKPWAKQVYWMYGVILDDSLGLSASVFGAQLKELGVETRPFFLGMHKQPALIERGLFHEEEYPVSERLAHQGLYLPSGLAITESQIDQVCDAITKIIF